MSESNSTAEAAAARKRKQFWAKVVSIAIVLVVALLKPKVEAWLESRAGNGAATAQADSDGINSIDVGPTKTSVDSGSSQANSSEVVVDDFDLDSFVTSKETAPDGKPGDSKTTDSTSSTNSKKGSTDNSGTSAKTSRNDSVSSSKSAKDSGSSSTSTKSPKSTKPDSPPPGKLTLVNQGRQEFRSTAGLMYVRGSQDGHRLKHVLQHAKDDLSKPVHGVYDGDGDRDKILAWIDIAYEKGKKGGKGTRQEQQGDRTIYTVKMDTRIGFVGGQKGQRNNNRPCQYLRLVLQNGNEVVTAYPSDSM